MENLTSQEISYYESLNYEIVKKFINSPLKNEYLHFWEKWAYLHKVLFTNLGLEVLNTIKTENELNQHAKLFLRKRRGMISAFAQKIKSYPDYKNEIIFIINTIKEHDEKFKLLLNQVLNKLLNEINLIQARRKVTNAYMNSHYYLGG